MTSIAVTASICASASEAALLVASFMPISLDLGTGLGHDSSLREKRLRRSVSYSEHPATNIRFTSPHSANIDCAMVDQQYGANLARAQPICAPVMEF